MYNILLHLFDRKNYERIASYGHKEKIVSFFESFFDDLTYAGDDPSIDEKLKVIRIKCESDNDKFKDYKFQLNHRMGLGGKFDFYEGKLDTFWGALYVNIEVT